MSTTRRTLIGGAALGAAAFIAFTAWHLLPLQRANANASTPAPAVAAPANPPWSVTCQITDGDFQLVATNNTTAIQQTPGWTVVLYDGSEIVASTATADESATGGYGALVLQGRYASPGEQLASNYWPVGGITSYPVTGCAAVA